ncbi:MAG: IS66 family insertion sequence element accessory protein TnpB [Verrucomicrobiales bacterium]|nr:IS66 family insertion sequence element accessory protein TnpB [Verrucomicrobiales bacterium]
MIGLGHPTLRNFLALEPSDMRKGFNGLIALAIRHLGESLARDALFVLINQRRTRIKLFFLDGTGLWLATKRLKSGRFNWPSRNAIGQKKSRLTPEALQLLIDGLERRAVPVVAPASVLRQGTRS